MGLLDEILMVTGSLGLGIALGCHLCLNELVPVYRHAHKQFTILVGSAGLVTFIVGLILALVNNPATAG